METSRLCKQIFEQIRIEIQHERAIVWALEHSKYYLFGNKFILQTDHQALLSALKNNRGSKIYQSRLSRWVDQKILTYFAKTKI